MTPPPAFSIYQSGDRPLPPDLQAILADVGADGHRFLALLRSFYIKSGLRELIPKYTALGQAEVARYRRRLVRNRSIRSSTISTPVPKQ